MPARALVSITRRIRTDSLPAYQDAWARLAIAARETATHAWRFRSAADSSLYIEFLEFKGGDDPRLRPSVANALKSLEEVATGIESEWLDTAEDIPTP